MPACPEPSDSLTRNRPLCTCNLADGDVVPIPILPPEIVNLLFELNPLSSFILNFRPSL